MSRLRDITCVSCGRLRPPGEDPCPGCGALPLAHKQTAAEFAERQRMIADRDPIARRMNEG